MPVPLRNGMTTDAAVTDDEAVVRLAFALFAVQAGFHGFTASLPVALAGAGVSDPEIGLIVGVASLVQIPAAFLAGVIVDRVGGLRVIAVGGLAYLVGCGIFLLPGVEPGGPAAPFLVARFCQGLGLAGTLPAAMSLVPRLVDPERQGLGLAFVGSAHNLTMVTMPPISLAILAATSLHGVALGMIGVVVGGLALIFLVPFDFRRGRDRPDPDPDAPPEPVARRRLGFAFRRSWAPLVSMVVLFIAYWGLVVAYLPQRAVAAGADIGLFFAADGLAVLIFRVPTGWLADRMAAVVLIVAGLATTAVSIVMLTLPLTTPILLVAGAIGGAGGGLAMTPILVELSRRSSDADRGSAFSSFSAALASALVLGSIGGGPVVETLGFEAAMWIGCAAVGVAVIVALADPRLRTSPGRRMGAASRA
jgi:MFS family permease